jgi:hypothetical protein
MQPRPAGFDPGATLQVDQHIHHLGLVLAAAVDG